MSAEIIYILQDAGEAAYNDAPNSAFVKKCQGGDLFIKDKQDAPGRKVYKCPILNTEVNLVRDVCYGPTDFSGCEHNRLT